jgi:hypothetical protein
MIPAAMIAGSTGIEISTWKNGQESTHFPKGASYAGVINDNRLNHHFWHRNVEGGLIQARRCHRHHANPVRAI